GLGIGDDPVDTSDDTGVGAGAGGGEDLHTDEACLLGNTVGGATDGTSNVSTVTVAVSGRLAGDGVVTGRSTATELGVAGVDTSVNNVGEGTGTRAAVVDVGGEASVPVGDAGKTPGSAGL